LNSSVEFIPAKLLSRAHFAFRGDLSDARLRRLVRLIQDSERSGSNGESRAAYIQTAAEVRAGAGADPNNPFRRTLGGAKIRGTSLQQKIAQVIGEHCRNTCGTFSTSEGDARRKPLRNFLRKGFSSSRSW
jgi:hypothetical protein